MEKRDRVKSLTPSLTSPKAVEEQPRHIRSSEPSFHRPFERTLSNGYERNHYTDYERRAMNEAILAQDRHVLQDMPRSRSTSSHAHNNHTDSRTYEQVFNERAFLEKQHEGIQARLIESEKTQQTQSYNNQRPNKFEYGNERPKHSDYPYSISNSYPHPEAKEPSSIQSQHHQQQQQPQQPPTHHHHPHPQQQQQHSHPQPQQPQPEEKLNSPETTGIFKYEAISPVLSSKLDIEERRIRESRLNGTYHSDESDEDLGLEESNIQRLLLISSGPACELDKSPSKLKFLRHFGLTTRSHRRGMWNLTTLPWYQKGKSLFKK